MWPGFTIGPDQYNDAPRQPAQTFQTLLAISFTLILDRQQRAIKYRFTQGQINAMFRQVDVTLFGIIGSHSCFSYGLIPGLLIPANRPMTGYPLLPGGEG